MCGCHMGYVCGTCREARRIMCEWISGGHDKVAAKVKKAAIVPEHEGIPPAPLYIARIRAGLD